MITSTLLTLTLFSTCAIQQDSQPDRDLFLSTRDGALTMRPLYDDEIGKEVRLVVRLLTQSKKANLTWTATAQTGFYLARSSTHETMAFYPTAIGRSVNDLRSFYVVGRNDLSIELERWSIDDSISVVGAESISGDSYSTFTPPLVNRTKLSMDNSMGDICAMTVNPWPGSPNGEELLVMEYASRDVYAIDVKTGQKTLRVPGSEVSGFRMMWVNQHSFYGRCLMFSRVGTNANPTSVSEPDLYIKYDTDYDGADDGSFLWPRGDGFHEHPISTDGVFLKMFADQKDD